MSQYEILLVDDEPNNLQVLRSILGEEYDLSFATDGPKALKYAQRHPPDLVLLDIQMPEMDGYEVCRRLQEMLATIHTPVIFVTTMGEPGDEKHGFEVGAVDYLTKPLSPPVVKARVATHLALRHREHLLEDKVRARTRELEHSHRAAISMLGHAGHYNDTDTGNHIWRMAAYAEVLALDAGWDKRAAERLKLAAPMHDTGKIGIPDTILKKPGKLTPSEWDIMRTHAEMGYEILRKGESPLFRLAAEIALYHHEKWDGSGYPRGLSGENIPQSARIVAIADVFDALTTKRPYKDPWPFDEALAEIENSAGGHFDPALAARFVDLAPTLERLRNQYSDPDQENGVDGPHRPGILPADWYVSDPVST